MTAWRQPKAPGDPAIWGIEGDIAVGIPPTPGPMGLLRIYAPYLNQGPLRMVNFIAIEPIVGGRRGFSELENRELWSAGSLEAAHMQAAKLTVGTVRRGTLSVFFGCEVFANGAKVVIEARFRKDRPHEVALRSFLAPGSAPVERVILTATMGNYGRLRRLILKDRVVEAKSLWPEFPPDDGSFAPHRTFPASELKRRGKEVEFSAETDEADPAKVSYAPNTFPGWFYEGKPARHAWRALRVPGLVGRVNARATYWASQSSIPGGIALENIELDAPFREGQEWVFAVEPT